jgi:6-phosphogluconolactonase (cycloisomerase 2 family)
MNNVYVQSNEADANRLFVFRRGAGGALSPLGALDTGGRGDGSPHLPSQGSVVVTASGRHVLVTNAGTGDVSLFAVDGDEPTLVATVPAGAAPKSVAERDGLVYVLNTGAPSLTGYTLGATLSPLDGATRELAPGSDPAQVGFTPDGETLVVTERGTNEIGLYAVHADGRLGERVTQPSSGPTPYGFAFAGDRLVVTEAFGAAQGKAAASSYALHGGSASPVSRSVGNGRSEICWAVAGNGGRHVFATNFADGAVSRYGIGADGELVLEDALAAVTVDGRPGLRDEGITSDGRFLYAVDADSGSVFGWSVEESGALAPVGSWNGLPLTIAGLAAH